MAPVPASRDMMVHCVEQRFGATRAPHPGQSSRSPSRVCGPRFGRTPGDAPARRPRPRTRQIKIAPQSAAGSKATWPTTVKGARRSILPLITDRKTPLPTREF
jgi:hypothetical protein